MTKFAWVILIGFCSVLILLPIYIATHQHTAEQLSIQPYEHTYNIIIKEKYIAHDGCRGRFLLRYYNKTMSSYYLLEDEGVFIAFNIGEPLIFWEKHDGVNYTSSVRRPVAQAKAEVEP